MSRREWLKTLVAAVLTVCLLAFSGIASAQGNSDNALARVQEVQERHTAKLMAQEGVIGTALGLHQGRPCILILTASDTEQVRRKIPPIVEGYPVVVQHVGEIGALDRQ